MHKLPLEFYSEAMADAEFEKTWSITSGALKTNCAIPAEFGGLGGGFSPEDLFLQALINCFVGTFKVYAKASRIIFSQVHVKGRLIVDQNASNKVMMKAAIIDIEIHGVERPDRIETIVSKALKDGFILNSVKTEIQYNLQIFDSLNNKLT